MDACRYFGALIVGALWAFHISNSFEEGCLMAVNLGDDADTTGAIYGQIAGAYYGEDGIPLAWRHRLCLNDIIHWMSKKIHDYQIMERGGMMR